MFSTHLYPLEPPNPPKNNKNVIFSDLKIGPGALIASESELFSVGFWSKFFFAGLFLTLLPYFNPSEDQ